MKKLAPYLLILASAFCLQPAAAQSWTAVKGVPNIGAFNPLLLTDGTVMIQDAGTSNWYKLTPDITGSYANGTWSQLASMPSTWAPLYMGSEVMPDGRVYAIGGEYNLGQSAWTGQSGVYDPVANTWTMLNSPWASSGDTATAVLPNGLVYIANAVSNDTAAFNPATNQYIHPYGAQSPTYNNEAGLTLLPTGNLFRVNCWTSAQAQIFNTTSLTWTVMTMPYNVCDLPDAEMGPAIVQYNGQVIQFGGNGSNIIYDPKANSWINAPSFPSVTAGQLEVADGAAALLPNGNVIVDCGPGYAMGHAYFYIWNGSTLTNVVGPPDADSNVGFAGNFLTLPTGQILFCDQSSDVELYNPGGTYQSSWAPTITSCPTQLHLGTSFTLSGTQLNGLSTATAYGDDEQSNTNYPLIRLTMKSTGHVYYCKEFSPSTMAIATGKTVVSTHFTVPGNCELGSATLQVVTNGIPSVGYPVTVYPQLEPYAVSLYQGIKAQGNLNGILAVDGVYYSGESTQVSSLGQVCAVEADFQTGTGITTIRPFASAMSVPGGTEQLYAYNFSTGTWDFITSTTFGTADTSVTGSPTAKNSNYVSSAGIVKIIVRAVVPSRSSTAPFILYVDEVGLSFD